MRAAVGGLIPLIITFQPVRSAIFSSVTCPSGPLSILLKSTRFAAASLWALASP